jgi:hypothetical protein
MPSVFDPEPFYVLDDGNRRPNPAAACIVTGVESLDRLAETCWEVYQRPSRRARRSPQRGIGIGSVVYSLGSRDGRSQRLGQVQSKSQSGLKRPI